MSADARRLPARRVGFPPMAGPVVHVLVLGSFPGVRSLEEARYYANPNNRFWRAMGPTCGIEPGDDYSTRLASLQAGGIALWDVLAACRRAGSLDQRIVRGSEEPNDLGALVAAHPELRAILLNGRSVAGLFHRHQIPQAFWSGLDIEILTLPSTSPAHAAMRSSDVIRAWEAALARVLPSARQDRHADRTHGPVSGPRPGQ